jgi:DNA-binding SARP family transcriptional activator/tetratricopeptide (TPR) repeat protein
VEFRLLGELQVRAGDRLLDLGAARQQAVLAALLVDAGRPVSAAVLIDRVWGERPPAQVRGVLYSLLSRIMRLLGEVAAAGAAPVGVERRVAGYLLTVDPDVVDLHRFERLVARAGAPSCPRAEQAAVLGAALGLWRGSPLAGIAGSWAAGVREVCRQQRLAAAIQWAQVVLQAGDPGSVLAVLPALIAEYPLAEPLEGLLMRALHAVGRDAEALDRYAGVRRRLAAELGVEPAVELRAVHQGLLLGELPSARQPSLPAQLPADVPGFTGREAELRELDRLLAPAGDRPPVTVISAVSGTAGVGKTALAVHWSHQVQDRFPDGQLYVNLRGYDPDQPVRPADALAGFLAGLGVADREIPIQLDDRAARYRTQAAGRRLLIVLDNASSVEQVRPLLPGTPAAAVVVTSRDSLPGLVATHGAHRLDLDLLPLPDAVTLLRTLIGDRVDAEPAAAAALAGHCARLPLALRIAAELALARPAGRLGDLVDELADEQQRMDLLDAGGDPRAAVSTVFSWSLRHLPPETTRLFRLLGAHPGPDIDPYAAAALAGTTTAHARTLLDALARAHLVHYTGIRRYGMHDLLRAYAAGSTAGDGSAGHRREALDRLFDYYLTTTATAMATLDPNEIPHRPPVPPATSQAPDLTGPDAARAWLDAERPVLVAVASHTVEHGWPTHTIRLSFILRRYLMDGHCTEARVVHGHALRAARDLGDRAGEAWALHGLGDCEQALALFRQLGDGNGQGRALNNLGIQEERCGRFGQAAAYLQQALTLAEQRCDRPGQAHVMSNLSRIEMRLGHYVQAADHIHRALALVRQTGDRDGEANGLAGLGHLQLHLGRHHQAADLLRQALALFRQIGSRSGQAYVLDGLGEVHTRLGRPGQAIDHHRLALGLFRELGDRDRQTWALNGLGEAAHAAGHHTDALTHHTDALALATDGGIPEQQARAHAGLGRAHTALGHPTAARHHYQHALAVYTELGTTEADDLRSHLANPDQRG